jgi:hypothetical protein
VHESRHESRLSQFTHSTVTTRLHRLQDRAADTLQVLEHIIIRNSKNVVTQFLQAVLSLSIGQSAIPMTFTIQLNNQAMFGAEEIDDEVAERHLPAKLQPLESAIP